FQAQASGSGVYVATSRDQALAVASEAPDQLAAVYYLNLSSTTQSTEEALVWLKHATHLGTLAKELLRVAGSPVGLRQEENAGETSRLPEPSPQPKQGGSQPNLIERLRELIENVLKTLKDLLGKLARLLKGEKNL
ncbi:MAG: hypothetical protein QXH70_09875, partial [Thermofilaceae archaeon]